MSDQDEEKPSEAGLFAIPTEGPGDPRPIVTHLVDTCELFSHLRLGEAVIMTIFRMFEKSKQGRVILGTMAMPVAQGAMKEMFAWLLANTCGGMMPDFILTLDYAWWQLATDHQRHALVFHELLHAHHAVDKDGELRFDDDGRPVFDIVGHDVEEFDEVVRRYGAWTSDIARFSKALVDGKVL